MEMTQGNLPKKGFALSARRLTLLASVAAVGTALMLAGPNTNWSQLFNASSASAADSTAQHPAGFADLVTKVKPAVISVRVKIPASAAPAMMQEEEGDNNGDNQQEIPAQPGSPFEKFFRQFGDQSGQGPHMGRTPQRHETIIGQGSGFFISADGYAVTNNH